MKISATSVYELERGDNWISPEMLMRLCAVLDVNAGVFFDDEPPAPPTVTALTKVIEDQERRIRELEEKNHAALSVLQRDLLGYLAAIDDPEICADAVREFGRLVSKLNGISSSRSGKRHKSGF